MALIGRPPSPVVDRFIAKCGARRENGCIEWQAYREHFNYGTFWKDGTNRLAHRVAYELFVGEVPAGQWVLHLCDNPPCVNPEHLMLGDHDENQRQRRLCSCGSCQRCRHREYMRDYIRRVPEQAERARERARAYGRRKRGAPHE